MVAPPSPDASQATASSQHPAASFATAQHNTCTTLAQHGTRGSKVNCGRALIRAALIVGDRARHFPRHSRSLTSRDAPSIASRRTGNDDTEPRISADRRSAESDARSLMATRENGQLHAAYPSRHGDATPVAPSRTSPHFPRGPRAEILDNVRVTCVSGRYLVPRRERGGKRRLRRAVRDVVRPP